MCWAKDKSAHMQRASSLLPLLCALQALLRCAQTVPMPHNGQPTMVGVRAAARGGCDRPSSAMAPHGGKHGAHALADFTLQPDAEVLYPVRVPPTQPGCHA